MGIILLFYKYVKIENPEIIKKWQEEICKELNLTGRILLAHEGINGTVGGSIEETNKYISTMNNCPLFENIDFKTAPGGTEAFPRMKISIKNEIVHLGIDPNLVTVKDTGIHLTPEEVHHLLENPPQDLVVLDTRNNYESAIGTFVGSITPDIRYFRQLPQYLDENIDQFKDKTVLMHCTGGVRCERATAYLTQKNVAKKIYQVKGGIHRYIEKFPNGFFRGKNYVFDKRISVKVNDDILGSCLHCKAHADQYFNCSNALCNKHFISCQKCIESFENNCSKYCQDLVLLKQAPKRKPLEKIQS